MAAGHRRRVMKKVFENGIETLLEHEFLELCLYAVYKRCDTNPIAHALLDKFGDLDTVCRASTKELLAVEGVGPAAAEYIKLLPHIAKGYSMHTTVRNKKQFKTRESMYERCVALLNGRKSEEAYVLCFDNMRHLIKEVKIGEGSPKAVDVSPRKIMDAIANTSTTSILICHNHPSGVYMPSEADFTMTKNIKQLVNTIGIELVDHIIVVDNEYISCIPLG